MEKNVDLIGDEFKPNQVQHNIFIDQPNL